MIALTAICFLAVGFTLGAVWNGYGSQDILKRLWLYIDVLEGDKRALTESLCRAQGRPYIQPEGKRDRIPSDGWWDAATRIEVTK